MNFQNTKRSLFLVLLLGLFTVFAPLSNAAEKGQPIVSVITFDVKADAEGFMELIDKAIKTARKIYPEGKNKTRIIAEHMSWKYAHLVRVITTYPNMEEYVKTEEALRDKSELQAINAEMYEAGFRVISTSHNTLVSEY